MPVTNRLYLLAPWILLQAACSAIVPSDSPVMAPHDGKGSDWKLVWSDEFDGNGLPDPAKWTYDTKHNKDGWFNHERQYYSRERLENARVENGRLIITARKEQLADMADYGGQAYTSARLTTFGKQEWTYGRFEVRARLPCGLGTWPAIWMLGSDNSPWPQNGEIDIMEHVGKKQGEILGTIHTAAFNHRIHTQKGSSTMVPDACGNFHRYQLTWTVESIRIGVDDVDYFEFRNPGDGDIRKWPFDKPQYLILNLAVGGDLGGPVDDSIFPVQMEIDYVRVYQK